MQKMAEKPHNQATENSIYKAIHFLIEECIRNGEVKKAELLKVALIQMKEPYQTLGPEEYDDIIFFLKRIVSFDKQTLENLISAIDAIELCGEKAVH